MGGARNQSLDFSSKKTIAKQSSLALIYAV